MLKPQQDDKFNLETAQGLIYLNGHKCLEKLNKNGKKTDKNKGKDKKLKNSTLTVPKKDKNVLPISTRISFITNNLRSSIIGSDMEFKSLNGKNTSIIRANKKASQI